MIQTCTPELENNKKRAINPSKVTDKLFMVSKSECILKLFPWIQHASNLKPLIKHTMSISKMFTYFFFWIKWRFKMIFLMALHIVTFWTYSRFFFLIKPSRSNFFLVLHQKYPMKFKMCQNSNLNFYVRMDGLLLLFY